MKNKVSSTQGNTQAHALIYLQAHLGDTLLSDWGYFSQDTLLGWNKALCELDRHLL